MFSDTCRRAKNSTLARALMGESVASTLGNLVTWGTEDVLVIHHTSTSSPPLNQFKGVNSANLCKIKRKDKHL